jgi:hypothetical protein
MATHQDKTTTTSAQSAPPANIADAFGQTRLLLIAAGKLADDMDETAGYALKSVLGAAEEKFEKALDWFEAKEWKASLDERKAAPEPTARPADVASSSTRPPLSSELLDVVDEVNEVRRLMHAAWMASHHLHPEDRDGMQVVLAGAINKLDGARDRLDKARGAPPRKAA